LCPVRGAVRTQPHGTISESPRYRVIDASRGRLVARVLEEHRGGLSTRETGLARSRPPIEGALPWIGSKYAASAPMFPDGHCKLAFADYSAATMPKLGFASRLLKPPRRTSAGLRSRG
jgi:hypothetical protein